MGYQEIGVGNQPGDGQGDSGRTGGQKLNSMLKELYEQSFMKAPGLKVSRTVSNPGNTDLTAFRADDICEGWEDTANKVRWIKGVVLDPTFVWPDDIDNESKFFITNDKLKV